VNKRIKWATVQPLNGGMSIGFEQAIEHPPEFVITGGFLQDTHYDNYLNNTKQYNVPILNMNDKYVNFVSDRDTNAFKKLNIDIDIVNYVPVCSGLSMLNAVTSKNSTHRRGDPYNVQNQNMYDTTNFVLRTINPKVAVFENAPNAYTHAGVGVVEVLKEIAKEHGYSMTLEKTDTFLHGIPQHRKRTFIYFWNQQYAPLLEYERAETVPLLEYLNRVDKNASHQDITMHPHDITKTMPYRYVMENYAVSGETKISQVFSRVFPHRETLTALQFIRLTDGFTLAVKWAKEQVESCDEVNDNAEYRRRATGLRLFTNCEKKINMGLGFWDGSAIMYKNNKRTNAIVSKNAFRLLHPEEERSLSVRELLWLMGMPDEYELLDPDVNKIHLPQSVPVATSKYVGGQCKLFVEGKLENTHSTFIKQNNEKQKIDYTEDSLVKVASFDF